MDWIRSRMTFANVVSLIALFVALGGTAIASVMITNNSQVGQGVISGHVPPAGKHPNIISNSVNGNDLSAGLKNSLTLHCPSGLQRAADLCFEPSLRSSATVKNALKTCASAGRRLPTAGELPLVFEHLGAPQVGQWTSSVYFEGGTSFDTAVGNDASRNLTFAGIDTTALGQYRCVTSATN